jgi:beta-glucanase (GH16 family)
MGTACTSTTGSNNGDVNDPRFPDEPTGDWTLTWSDEFDGEAGSRPSIARWTADIGGHGWGNEQLEYDTDRAENAQLDGEGNLNIIARQESYGGNEYTSARLVTRGRLEQTYGRFEARLKLPQGQGIWPAFWLLGCTVGGVDWPHCGEIDILELRGQQPSLVLGAVHGPGYSGDNNIGGSHEALNADLSKDFHVYAVEWSPRRITWFFDGTLYHEVTVNDVPGGADRWVFDHPFYLILNVAVGGTFVGPPNASTQLPQTMVVDYVRVYQRQP